jgi:hypothetical protein
LAERAFAHTSDDQQMVIRSGEFKRMRPVSFFGELKRPSAASAATLTKGLHRVDDAP